MRLGYLALAGSMLVYAGAAQAQSFVNGGFEAGNASGWAVGGGNRTSELNPSLAPSQFLTGGSLYNSGIASSHSSIINASYVDPNLGSKLGSTVYSGNYSWRVEDTTDGGYASVIQQRVNGYTDANIFFAWKSVLEGAHGVTDAATMIISLRDLTTNTEIIRREYNAASGGGGVDPRFTYDNATNLYYTSQWQIEQLAIGANLQGHDFLLSVLAADCQPSAHTGYVYLDGFGAVTPPAGGVPEPTTWAMMIMGFGLMGGAMRRQRANVKFAIA
jgi:hypothetical protein